MLSSSRFRSMKSESHHTSKLSSVSPRGRQMANVIVAKGFPTQQLFILALCRICEPIAFMSIFPYIYYMIQSFNITSDDRQISIYAGMVTSAFAFAEFSTGVPWGRLSDKVGRKPVLLTGLAGTGFSMLVLGFAPNLPVAMLGRALGGLLNGNIGVLQTTVAEIVTVKEHQPRAYSIMPFVWCLGSILGPALGGALARPCDSFPHLFSERGLFGRFPFLLPNVVCAGILVIGVVIGLLFLEETHEIKKHERDRGRELGKWIVQRFKKPADPVLFHKAGEANLEESRSLLEDDEPPGYRTTEGSPPDPSSRAQSPSAPCSNRGGKRERPGVKPRGVHKAFPRQIILIIIAYGILAFHTITFDQLMPVFLSTPVSHEPPSSFFKFTGGFALSSKTIGFMLSIQGIYSMTAQVFLFPVAARYWGSLKTFRFVVLSWPILYVLVPYTVLLPPRLQMPGVFLCLLWRVTAQVLAYPSHAILLTNSAPSMLVLGAINGVAASTASLSRAFGPTVSGFINSWGLKLGCTGLAWWVNGLVCVLGALESLMLRETRGRMDHDDEGDVEDAASEPLINPLDIDTAILAASVSNNPPGEALIMTGIPTGSSQGK